MTKRAIAYIDGFNLYNGVHDTYIHKFLWLDVVKLVKNMRPHSNLVSVKYFTSTLLNDPEAQSRQSHYISALQASNPGVLEVFYGRYQAKAMTCKACGETWTTYEEKETDVSIAVEMVADAASGQAEDFYVVSGDSDMAPAIRRMQAIRDDVFCVAFFPPQRKSEELQRLMPNSMIIGRSKLGAAQLDLEIDVPAGRFSCPPKWRAGQFESDTPIDVKKLSYPMPKPGPHLHARQRS
jgi:uncharacterized LabA/DUF88 family protein